MVVDFAPLPFPPDDQLDASRSAIRIGLITGAVLLVPLVAMQFSDEVDWGVFDFVFVAVLIAGTGRLVELIVSRPSRIGYRLAAVGVAIAAIVLGGADDAPGLVVFGLLLIAATVVLTLRPAGRSAQP